ncbi:MAG: thioesterase family protein [Pseudomonas sp.]|uniref:thioesterase family protein n=1 Tax=Pseudomonas abieticivorans TaxID=2931382 RepID=UPI0020BEA12A|nr:thioesterase family protein [Pseudomonas sp. PIA16]MDE1167057.1 thioesterase family protein [Pseudomonas sp.]
MISYQTTIIEEWVDYNGHLRDAFYLLIFSYATDAFMERIGVDPARDNHSLFTLECHLNFLHEVKRGEAVQVHTQVIGHDSKRVHLYHSLHVNDAQEPVAASEQMLLHVSLEGPKSTHLREQNLEHLKAIVMSQAGMPAPCHVGRVIALPA